MSRHSQLFVGRLPLDSREKDIESLFKKYGSLVRCNLKSGTGMAYAFVDYEDKRDAEDAIKYENGRDLRGQTIVVEWARGPSSRPPMRSRTSAECYRCHRHGHWARDCPELERDRYKARRYSRSNSRSRSRRSYRSRSADKLKKESRRSYSKSVSRSPSPKRKHRSSRSASKGRSPKPRGSRSPRARGSRSPKPRNSRSVSPKRVQRSRSGSRSASPDNKARIKKEMRSRSGSRSASPDNKARIKTELRGRSGSRSASPDNNIRIKKELSRSRSRSVEKRRSLSTEKLPRDSENGDRQRISRSRSASSKGSRGRSRSASYDKEPPRSPKGRDWSKSP